MSPRDLAKWRRNLFSIYVGHLPFDITKKELVQLFSEVGNVQDVHLQPAAKGSYTYGFIRFCTLDECRDAVALLHGRFLGNRTITVEYACETKERLAGDVDASDLPIDKKDKLLRNDFPRLEHHRPMSDAESQEKMVLWKLRCSATRQKSSGIEFITDGQEGSKEEVLMNALQEIVKKVASLPANTSASPSGSEGSPCSPWIVKEINGNSNGVPIQQSHPAQCPDKPSKEEALKCNGTQEYDMPQMTNVKHTHDMESTENQNGLVQPQTLPLIRERQAQSLEANVANSFSSPDSQSIRNGPFEASLSPSGAGVTPTQGMYVSASSPGVTPSPERYVSPTSPGVTPSPGSYVSPTGPNVTPSPERYVSPTSPGVTPSPVRHISPTSPGMTPFPGMDVSPTSPGVAPSPGMYMSPSSPAVAHCPGREDSSQSEVETTASDSVSLGSLSPERPLRQHCQFCHGHCPTRGHMSESSLSESTGSTSSSSHPSASSCEFCCEDKERLGKAKDSHTLTNQKLGRSSQYGNNGAQDGPPNGNHFTGMGLCSFDSGDHYIKQTQYPSGSLQPRGASVSSGLSHHDQRISQAGAVGNARMDSEVTNNRARMSSNQCYLPRDQSGICQGSTSPREQQAHVVTASHITKKEVVESVPSVTRHHPQDLPPQNEKKSSITGSSATMPLSVNTTTGSPSAVPTSPPAVSVSPSGSDTVRPLLQQPLHSNPPPWQGQPQHVHPLLANMMAARLQQSGFLRQQFGNAPFLPPGVFNPLVQQQLMALGLPFGLPFHTGGHQAWPGVGPRGPVRHPVQGYRPPVGRSGTGPVGRGRSFAPRFHHPGVVNIRTHDDLEKSSTGNSSTSSLERTSSAMNAPEMQKEAVEDNRSTANDAQKGNVRSSWTPASPENTNMKGNVRPSGTPASPENINMESASRASADVKSISDSSCVKHDMMPSPSTGSDVSPKSIFNTMPKESREGTGCQSTSPSSQEAGKMGRIGSEGHLLASSPSSTLPKQEDYLESPGTKKTPPCKITQSELFLKEQKSELKRIKSENETLRQSVDWRRSGGMADNSSYPREKWEALKCQIHLKEVHLQKEKEMILARKAEQEILYEREKLECSWDQQLKKELETEKRIGETENKIHLAKLENELLRLYQNLHGSKELKDSSITTDDKL